MIYVYYCRHKIRIGIVKYVDQLSIDFVIYYNTTIVCNLYGYKVLKYNNIIKRRRVVIFL